MDLNPNALPESHELHWAELRLAQMTTQEHTMEHKIMIKRSGVSSDELTSEDRETHVKRHIALWESFKNTCT